MAIQLIQPGQEYFARVVVSYTPRGEKESQDEHGIWLSFFEPMEEAKVKELVKSNVLALPQYQKEGEYDPKPVYHGCQLYKITGRLGMPPKSQYKPFPQ